MTDKLKHGTFHLNLKKRFFTARVMEHWNRLQSLHSQRQTRLIWTWWFLGNPLQELRFSNPQGMDSRSLPTSIILWLKPRSEIWTVNHNPTWHLAGIMYHNQRCGKMGKRLECRDFFWKVGSMGVWVLSSFGFKLGKIWGSTHNTAAAAGTSLKDVSQKYRAGFHFRSQDPMTFFQTQPLSNAH